MCLAVPGKILSIKKNEAAMNMARVDFAGVVKEVCIDWLDDANTGDYVIVHAGFALNKLDEQDAIETLQILRTMGDLPEEA